MRDRQSPELYHPDGLHLTRKGYLLWIPPLRTVLSSVVPPERTDGKPAAGVTKK